MRIFLTGSSGFIGTSILKYFNEIEIVRYRRGDDLQFDSFFAVLHFAGKAHDLKNVSSSSEYYEVNTEFTKKIYDAFIVSKAKIFITLSSVKAVADLVEGELTENHIPNPITHYGKSKFLAEQYILSKELPEGKRVYILRPCMIHGPGNKGNLNLLYKVVSIGLPWPLGLFNNLRSFCSIDNLLFIINQLLEREDIPSGIYNVSDDIPLSTNEIIIMIAASKNRNPRIWKLPPKIIYVLAKLGDTFKLPLNTERLKKLTQNYLVSNRKLVKAIGSELPVNSRDGLLKTINSFYE